MHLDRPAPASSPLPTTALTWPPMREVIGDTRAQDPVERLKYRARCLLAGRHRQRLLDTLAAHPVWLDLFRRNPRHFHVALSHFLDRRWSAAQRFAAACQDLQQAHALWGTGLSATLVSGQPLALFEQAGLCTLRLAVNPINLQEGRWALMVEDATGRRLFNLSFGFLEADTVLIASMQGSPGGDTPAIDAIQKLTKDAHGLRPHHLLLAAFQSACAAWGVKNILAIDPHHHIKGRWNQRQTRLKFDYRALWQEAGGTPGRDGHWQLPAEPRKKSLDDIPSRKRSQYRKRFQMLDDMGAAIAARLTA